MSTPPTPPSGDAPLPPSGDTAPAPQMQTTQPTQVGGAPAKSGKGKLIGIIVGVLLIVGIAVAAVVILPSLAKAKNKALAIKAKGEEKIQPDGSQMGLESTIDQTNGNQSPPSPQPPAGVPPAGVPPAGVPPAGVPPAGVPPAGVPPAGVPPTKKSTNAPSPVLPGLPLPSNLPPGRLIKWTINGGKKQIDQLYLNKPEATIQTTFGAPDEKKDGYWIYKTMTVRNIEGGGTMTKVYFGIRNGIVFDVRAGP